MGPLSARCRRAPRGPAGLVVAGALSLAACSDQPTAADAGVATAPCPAPTASFGGCALVDGGVCTGVPDEQRALVPLVDGDSLPVVVGPQGATMFVLALQTRGIHGGSRDPVEAVDNPIVDILLTEPRLGDVGRYRSKPVFEPGDADPEVLVAAGLFVIVADTADTLAGRVISATGDITDRDGERRCARLSFVAAAP